MVFNLTKYSSFEEIRSSEYEYRIRVDCIEIFIFTRVKIERRVC